MNNQEELAHFIFCVLGTINQGCRIFMYSVFGRPNIRLTEYSHIRLNRIFGQPNTEYSNTEYRIRIFTRIFDIPASNLIRKNNGLSNFQKNQELEKPFLNTNWSLKDEFYDSSRNLFDYAISISSEI